MSGGESASVVQRLSRRRAYDAVGAVEASFRRSAAEPQRVRVPVDELAAFIDHAQRLMAHLSVIRLSLAQRSDWARSPDVVAAIADARAGLAQCLRVDRAPDAQADAIDPFDSLPADRTLADRRAWFLRRLRITVDDAHRAGEAARRLLAAR